MGHSGKGLGSQLHATDSSGDTTGWVYVGRTAVSALFAKAQDHDLIPADCHKIVHAAFTVPDGKSLLLETDAKLVILDG